MDIIDYLKTVVGDSVEVLPLGKMLKLIAPKTMPFWQLFLMLKLKPIFTVSLFSFKLE